jgi:integrase
MPRQHTEAEQRYESDGVSYFRKMRFGPGLLPSPRIDASGRHETARRSRILIGEVFRYGNLTFKVDGDPTTMLRGVLPKRRRKHHPAITDPAKVGALLNVIDDCDGWPAIRAALQIAALCFPRPGELRHAKWQEIDLPGAIWRIPAERMKAKLPHDIPLSLQAIRIFERLYADFGRCEYVFPSIRAFNRPMSENTMNCTLRRLGYRKDEHCAHGFRTTASTLLNEARIFRHDIIETQLSHLEPNEVRASYNRAKYWPERVEMMQSWANLLDDFRIRALI